MQLAEALMIGLAAFRLASLFVREDGPWDAFGRVRRLAGVPDAGEVPGGLATVLTCMWCAGVWTAALSWGLWQVAPWAVVILAAAAVVMVADRYT